MEDEHELFMQVPSVEDEHGRFMQVYVGVNRVVCGAPPWFTSEVFSAAGQGLQATDKVSHCDS